MTGGPMTVLVLRMMAVVCLVLGFVASNSASVSAATKPNFVVIFIDDMGYGDIGPFGSSVNDTPHLERLSSEGMKLTSFYAAPVCSASRAQLLTGSYAPRVSVPGVFFPAGNLGLNPAEETVADYLQKLGYATTCIGKWHLGDQPEFLPTRQGFDHYFGIPYSNDMQRVSTETGLRVVPLLRDEKVEALLEDEGQRQVTRDYTKEAVKFISKERNKPFFLYMPHTAMHVPLFPHESFQGKSRNGIYGDWVQEVDWSVGQIMAALKRNNLDDNTLVIFTSDNGPWASKGSKGGVSGPLRGSKGATLEGGVREPTIVRWPGKIKAGSVCDAIAGTTDILPTLVSLAGGTVDASIKIDGKDITDLLFGETTESAHEAWHYFRGNSLEAIRSGPWKLALKPQSLGMGIREKPKDLLGKNVRLYNLDDEIGEVTNVAEQHPEVVARLQRMADEMLTEFRSTGANSGVRPPGRVENPVTLYPTQTRVRKKKK
ncbi:sulfatase [bacterium]|nr:sulfatase [Rubripirellula sp.]MDA7878113.1 sulfatase [bacterium]MDB4561373.1 sulfatase [bacterium]MDB4621401.1 sulfatase [Rubripirellula sp.]